MESLDCILENLKKRIDDNERWMSQVHVMCTDLGIQQGNIEDRLFAALARVWELIRLEENLNGPEDPIKKEMPLF